MVFRRKSEQRNKGNGPSQVFVYLEVAETLPVLQLNAT